MLKYVINLILVLYSMASFAAMPYVNEATIPSGIVNAGTNIVKVATTTQTPAAGDAKIRLSFKIARVDNIDPLVFPGVNNSTHFHDFLGNTGVNINSTTSSLFTSGTSTMLGGWANRSSYWMPIIVDNRNGNYIAPLTSLIYYSTVAADKSIIQPVPQGLKLVFGNSMATTLPTSVHYAFYCNKSGLGNYIINSSGVVVPNASQQTIPNCYGGSQVIYKITAPSCWDGVNLDSVDHKSHMTYPSGNVCPTNYPQRIAEITFVITHMAVADGDTNNWMLSSDASTSCRGCSLHGDIMEAFMPLYMDMITVNLMRADLDGGSQFIGIDPNDGLNKMFIK